MCREWICKILFSFGLLKPICQLWDSTSANVHIGIISTLHEQVAVIVDHLHLRFAPDVLLGRKSHIILERYDAHKGAPNWPNLNCGQSWILYETLPKAQRTRGLSSGYQSNFFRSYHKFSNNSLSDFIIIFSLNQASISKPQSNISISTKLKLQNLDQT